MKIEQKTVYICEHCNRKMLGKGAMSRHEKFCNLAPNNLHKCFQYCKHLKKTEFIDNSYNGTFKKTTMLCEKRNVKMYSYKFEKNTNKPINALKFLERMPLECNLYEDMRTYKFFHEVKFNSEFPDF